MSPFLSLYFLASESEGIKLNTNLFETNLINILLLLVLLVYVLGNFLSETLSSRQEQIVLSLQDCEKRLKEANERLVEAKIQWQQAQILLLQFKKQANESQYRLIQTELDQASKDLGQRFKSFLMVLRYREQQTFQDTTKLLSRLAINEATTEIKARLGSNEQSSIIDTKINRLGGQL